MKVVFFALFLLSGCSSGLVSPDALKPASRDEIVVLTRAVSYSKVVGLIPERANFGLASGTYRAEKTNDTGVFYRGEGHPVWVTGERTGNLVSARRGGIWVPYDLSATPRIYAYFDIAPQTWENLTLYSNQNSTTNLILERPMGAAIVGDALGFAIVSGIVSNDLGKIHFLDGEGDENFSRVIRSSVVRTPVQ